MKIFLAPMEGITDFLIRQMFTEIGGYDQCTTEFVRVTNLLLPDHVFLKYCPELKTGGRTLSGTPVFVQILGGRPDVMAENALAICKLGAPGIDLNFGCPAPTVNNHDGGAAILKNPHRVYDITRAVRLRVPENIPVTVKMRLGYSIPNQAIEIAQSAEAAGASRITIHARTRDQGYRPPAHWQWLGKINSAVKTPLVANGDIWSVEDYKKCFDICGIEDVMLGRSAFVQPDLALQIKGLRLNFSQNEKFNLISRFISLGVQQRSDTYALNRAKQWFRQMALRDSSMLPVFEKVKVMGSSDEVSQFLR